MAKAPSKRTAKKNGRPTKRTLAVVARIIEGLTAGTPLTVLCTAEDMPGVRTVYDWMDADETLSADIARARDMGFDAIAYATRETARGRGDSTDDVKRDKLIVDTDLKLLAKWDPKRYGDRLALAGDDSAPLRISVTPEDAAL